MELCGDELNDAWEPTLVNLGHSFRKLGQYDKSIQYYLKALSLYPDNSTTLSSLAFTYQLQLKFDLAIDYYHKALSIRSEDSFALDMLSESLELRYNNNNV